MILPFHEDFISMKFLENKTLMKISEFTEIEGLVHSKLNYTRESVLSYFCLDSYFNFLTMPT